MFRGVRFEQVARVRPLADQGFEETTVDQIVRAVSVLTCLSGDNTDKMLRQIRLILDTPALPARYPERQSQWQAEITGILARRTGLDAGADLRPALAAGVALAAVQTALSHWADSGGTKNMDELADQAFALVAPALALTTDAS